MSGENDKPLAPIISIFEPGSFESLAVQPSPAVIPVNNSENAPLRVRPLENAYCAEHCRHVIVDVKTRLLECSCCGRTIEAFDWVLKQTNELETQDGWVRRLKQERNDLCRQIEAIKKQLANLRQAVRRAGGRPVERHELGDSGRQDGGAPSGRGAEVSEGA